MATSATDFLRGKIGKFGDSALTYAKNISKGAKELTVEDLQNKWDTYIKQSPDELANIARRSMERKNTILSNLNMDEFQSNFNNSASRTNAEYASAYNSLKQKISSGNAEGAKEIASDISDRFGDGKYLDFLIDAEAKQISIGEQIKTATPNMIKSKYIKDMKDKIGENKIANNFLDDKSKEWAAKKAYDLQAVRHPQYYFSTDDKKTNRIRAGVVGGTYLGSSMVVRGIQGGSPITNEYGERDIAGIPFI